MSTKLTHQEIAEKVNSSKGKRGGWPSCFNYKLEGDHVFIVTNMKFKKVDFRRLDPWGIAFFIYVQENSDTRLKTISFILNKVNGEGFKVYLEAFKRRVSFLKINNEELNFEIRYNSQLIDLYSEKKLFTRPKNEILHDYDKMKARDDKDKPGRLEKDFQTFLIGKGLENDVEDRTNERLAILGEDFFDLKKKNIKLFREFPTGVFEDEVSKVNRILPTKYIDIVTLNKYRNLSIIELKLNDVKLEVLSQILDYVLFFRCYRDKLSEVVKNKFGCLPYGEDIICYVVNNRFHEKFDNIFKYYSTENKSYSFKIKRVLLGKTYS